MSDGDDQDDSDWLSRQFDATEQLPTPPAEATTPPAEASLPPAAVTPPPVVTPPRAAAVPPTVTPPVVVSQPPVTAVPPASAPEPNSGGGFNWGLKPTNSVAEPPAVTPAVAPPSVVVSPPTPTVVAPVVPAVVAPPIVPPVAPPVVAPPVVIPPVVPTAVTAPPAVVPPVVAPVTPPPLVQPPVAATPAQAPAQASADEPTKPLSWSEFAASQQQEAVDQPTEAYTVQPWLPVGTLPPVAVHPDEPVEPTEPADPTSAIDSLFGDHKFQDYEEVGVLTAMQVPPAAVAAEPGYVEPREPREPLSRTQKILMGVAGGLIGLLILVGLFFLGQHLGSAAAATPVAKKTGAASATPTPAGTGGPAAPGTQQWSALQGGECIQPFSSAWAITFTVVACTADHDAEMVFKGTLPDSSDTKYPSASSFQKEITPLCSAPTAINYAAAAAVTDLQVSFSYPPNTAMWLKGDRAYYCFVDRVSGGNLPGDLSVPKTP